LTGIEFLHEVKPLHPDSRRVLLAAYADTDVAIAGINDIALDHYLLTPWDPPEHRLYPLLDDLLAEWRARVTPPFEGIRILGSQWSPQSFAAKEFLSRNIGQKAVMASRKIIRASMTTVLGLSGRNPSEDMGRKIETGEVGMTRNHRPWQPSRPKVSPEGAVVELFVVRIPVRRGRPPRARQVVRHMHHGYSCAANDAHHRHPAEDARAATP